MERWLRILGTTATAPLRRRMTLEDTSVLDLRVGLFQADLRHASDTALMGMTELGRVDLLARTGLLVEGLRRRWSMPLGSILFQVRRPCRRFGRVQLHTRVIYWDERWVYVEHRIVTNGHIAAVGLAKCCVTEHERRVAPDSILEIMGKGATRPERPALLDELDWGETLLLWDAEADHGDAWTASS